MKLLGKFHNRRGFTLAELLIVIAIMAILITVSVVLFDPNLGRRAEYDKNAESVAVAAQSRFNELRNAGMLGSFRSAGEAADTDGEEPQAGGYRVLFSYTQEADGVARNEEMDPLLPFGALESSVADGYFAIGFQSENGSVGEVFWRETPFAERSVGYLRSLSSDAALRQSGEIGYYSAPVDEGDVAFARLPAPQVTVESGEELVLSVFVPRVRELEELGRRIALRVSLADAEGNAYEGVRDAGGNFIKSPLSLDSTAIYRTYSYGTTPVDQTAHGISMGTTYRIVLDSPGPSLGEAAIRDGYLAQNGIPSDDPPAGKFAAWAARSEAFGEYFALGDNVRVTVTVFCLNADLTGIDSAYLPRSASAVFNGWFESYDEEETVSVSCGRHLQNLGKLARLKATFEAALPSYDAAGEYTGGSPTEYMRDADRYEYRGDVQSRITRARQTKAIDFHCAAWETGSAPIAFEPLGLPAGFEYYGNYLPIENLYVDAPYGAGLFGSLCGGGVYDVRLADATVVSRFPVELAEAYGMGAGALVGTGSDCEIVGCQAYLKADTAGERARVAAAVAGGLVGRGDKVRIAYSSASLPTGSADGSSLYAGGLVGCLADGTLSRCYAAGMLTGVRAGGLVGAVGAGAESVSVETCYSAGHIEAVREGAAGLIGTFLGESAAALRAEGVYCAVIYGRDGGSGYEWSGTVFGTFEGDGGKNYYLPQAGIAYAEGAGLPLYSAAELRRARIDLSAGGAPAFGGFVGDYAALGAYESAGTLLKNPTYADGTAGDGNGTHYFTDSDHGIYNTVVPYTERGELTKFYPYPLLPGIKLASGRTPEENGVLVHYGDWLTADLIAADDGTDDYHEETARGEAVLGIAAGGLHGLRAGLLALKEDNGTAYTALGLGDTETALNALLTVFAAARAGDVSAVNTEISAAYSGLKELIAAMAAQKTACEEKTGDAALGTAAEAACALYARFLPQCEKILTEMGAQWTLEETP